MLADETKPPTDDPATGPADPAGSGGAPGTAPGAVESGSWLGVGVAFVLGLGLRIGWATHLGGMLREWEADSWLRAWFGQDWSSVNRVRPVGAGWLHHRIIEVFDVSAPGIELRLAAVALSVVGLFAAIDLAFVVWRASDIKRRSALTGVRWITWIWALSPALAGAAVRPDGVLPTGAALCLLVSSMLRWQMRPSPWTWLLLALSGGAAVACGGVAIVAALAAGLVVYLLPVPPFGRMAATLSALLAALALAHVAQNGPDPTRTWRPDTAGAYSVLSLVEAPPLGGGDNEPDADRRATEVLVHARDQLGEMPPFVIGRRMLDRLLVDLTGPHRFDEFDPGELDPTVTQAGRLALAVWDGLLRGGLLLFAVATLTALRRRSGSSFPRAGGVAAFAVLLLLTIAGATGPFALAGLDLALLGLAGGGLIGADPKRGTSRWTGFLVGGLLLAAFPVAGWLGDREPSPWIHDLGHRFEQGRSAVERARAVAASPDDVTARLAMTEALIDAHTPFLRLGEPALDNGRVASQLAMASDSPEQQEAALEAYVTALVEVGRLDEAQEVADQAQYGPEGPTARQRVLIGWLQLLQRQRRERGDG